MGGDEILSISKSKPARSSARILGLEGLVGTVEAGKLANLVLLEGNPLHGQEPLACYHASLVLSAIAPKMGGMDFHQI